MGLFLETAADTSQKVLFEVGPRHSGGVSAGVDDDVRRKI
jgi:hypothetical protein